MEGGVWRTNTPDELKKDDWQVEDSQSSHQTLFKFRSVIPTPFQYSKSLNLLAQDGYIQKIRGKGSVILDVDKWDFPVSGIVSFKELATKLKLDAHTAVHELSIVKADETLRAKLSTEVGELVWKVIRVRESTARTNSGLLNLLEGDIRHCGK